MDGDLCIVECFIRLTLNQSPLIFSQVLSRQELNMLPTFRHLLKMLSTFDAIFLLFTLSLFCVSAWSDHYNDYIR